MKFSAKSTSVRLGGFCLLTFLAGLDARAACLSDTINGAVNPPANFAIVGLAGSTVHLSSGPLKVNGATGIGASGRFQLDGGAILNSLLYADPTAQVSFGAGELLGVNYQSMSKLQAAAILLSKTAAALTPTKKFSNGITRTTTITGNGGQNVILISGNFHLSGGQQLYISGGSSDTFFINVLNGLQLDGGANINVAGVPACQVLFNFPDVNGQGQFQTSGKANTAGIYLAPSRQQMQINGGFHDSEFISGGQLSFQSNPQVTAPSPGVPTPLSLACPSSQAQLNVAYSSAFVVSGGTPAYTYSLGSGSLPMGLTLNTTSGLISGTPTQTGTFTFTGKVVDSSTPKLTAVTASCSIVVGSKPATAACLSASISSAVNPAANFAGIGLQGSQFLIQNGVQVNGALGIGASGQFHLFSGIALASTLYADPTATVQIDSGSSLAGGTLTQSMSNLQTAAINLSNSSSALTPTQTFSQINSSLTITGNGGQNVISVTGNFHLQNGNTLTISGGSSDTFIINAPGGMQLDDGSGIVLAGVPATQVLFNFAGNGGQIQIGKAATAGIFLAPFKQMQITGGVHNSEFISGGHLQLQNAQVTAPSCVAGPTPPASSCKTTSSLSTLVQPPNVVAYVPNGAWGHTSTGVQVVPIEPAATPPSSIATAQPVNSCASNSVTGETVCTANNNEVYLISNTTLNTTLHSAANFATTFSGGSCVNCGVTINAFTNTALLGIGLNTAVSGSGLQFLNLATNTFSAAVPARHQISEELLWDPVRNLILSPGEQGVYDLFQTSSSSTPEFANFAGAVKFDSAAEDCLTGIALGTDEDASNLFITDLTQAKFTPGAPIGSWTAPSTLLAIPDFVPFNVTEEGISGVAVAQGTHLGIVTGEFPGPPPAANAIIAFQLPSTSGSGTPTLQDYVVANLPNDPNGQVFQLGCDPHTVTAYVSPSTNKAIGVVTDYTPNCATDLTARPAYLGLIDLQGLLNAPRVVGTHTAQNPLPAGIVTFVKAQ